MTRPLIVIFPGQSSRDAEMIARLATSEPELADLVTTWCSEALGRPLDLGFTRNVDVQVGVFAVTLAYWRLFQDVALAPVASAGLSLGEYAHLMAIKILSESDALMLVTSRGRAYDAGPRGVMAVAQPVSVEEAEAIVADLHERYGWDDTDLAVSNDNSPRQCVVAGSERGVNAFMAEAEEALFAQCTVIETQVPMHTARFRPTVELFAPALTVARLNASGQNYWPNVLAAPVTVASPETIVSLLSRHVCERVRWRETVDALNARYPDALFVEVGPRSVLGDMLVRRWIGKERVVSLDDRSGITPRQKLKEIAVACR